MSTTSKTYWVIQQPLMGAKWVDVMTFSNLDEPQARGTMERGQKQWRLIKREIVETEIVAQRKEA